MSFLNPGLLWGLALISVPILIHILNRQRFKRVPWAATRFLLAAFQKTNRRARLENLLLLLLRCLIIGLLALALARPLVTPEGALAQVLPGERPNVVVVLDNSYSMGYRGGGDRVYDRALGVARQIIDEKRQDRTRKFSLILTAEQYVRLPLVRDGSADDVLEAIRLSDEPATTPANPGSALDVLDELLSADETAREIYWITDLQRNGWLESEIDSPQDSEPTDDSESAAEGEGEGEALPQLGLANLFRSVAQRAPTHVIDVGSGSRSPANLAVVDVGTEDRSIAINNAVTFTARVRNFSTQDRPGVTATLLVDGNKQPVKTLDLAAEGEATVAFRHVFGEAGFHEITVQLESDGLLIDNWRTFAFEVRDGIQVLIVSGDERPDDPAESESFFLSLALDPIRDDDGRKVAPTFLPKVIEDTVFDYGQETLSDYDLIVLANVPSIEPQVVEDLERYVRRGGSLWITFGDQVMPSRYNQDLFKGGLGSGLLPAEVFDPAPERGETSYYQFTDVDYDHPILQLFREDRFRSLFSDVPVRQFQQLLVMEADEDVRVIARFDDEAKSPAILERPLDRGRVLLFATSIDGAWNDLVRIPIAFLPLTHDTVYHLSGQDHHVHNLPVGSALRRQLSTYPSNKNIPLTFPSGDQQYFPVEASVTVEDDRETFSFLIAPMAELYQPGVYRLSLNEDPDDVELFALSLDPAEGDLRRFSPREFERSFEGIRVLSADSLELELSTDESRRGGELWKYLIAAAALFLALESLFAWRIGNHGRS